jgi:Mg2+-importing ATPase
MWYVFDANTPDQDPVPVGLVRGGLLTQTLIVHMIRTPKIPFLQSRAAMPLMVMTRSWRSGFSCRWGSGALLQTAGTAVAVLRVPADDPAGVHGADPGGEGFYIRRFGWQ